MDREERIPGACPDLGDEGSAEVRRLRKENAMLKGADGILVTASASFGDEASDSVE